mmetsp:Transcript_86975/g.106664  ORF Transcript_86975/g.106664 Transcript_86975/m.106664 type:complete len:260 (-) Transcript_86975:603-1382(-)
MSVFIKVNLLSLLLDFIYIINGCQVGVLDLSFIGTNVKCEITDSTPGYVITYQPCGDYVVCSCDCNSDGQSFMALATTLDRTGQYKTCTELAMSTDIATFGRQKINGNNAYVITYDESLSGESIDLRFYCGETTLDSTRTTCGIEPGLEPIRYYLEIYSSNACTAANGAGVKSGLSGGWIFIICIIWVFILYCFIGYLINGFRTKNWKDIKGNIPNYGLWVSLPKACIAGCIFTFGYCMGKCLKNRNNDANETLVDDEY